MPVARPFPGWQRAAGAAGRERSNGDPEIVAVVCKPSSPRPLEVPKMNVFDDGLTIRGDGRMQGQQGQRRLRKYSIDEIDRMRTALEVIAAAPMWSYDPGKIAAQVENQLRTYMMNGTSPEELVQKAKKIEDARLASQAKPEAS